MRLSAHACHMLHAPHAPYYTVARCVCHSNFMPHANFVVAVVLLQVARQFSQSLHFFFPAICRQDKRFNYKMRLDACDFLTGEWARHVNKRRARGLNEVATAHQNDGWHFDSQLGQLGKCAMHSSAQTAKKLPKQTASWDGWMAWGGRKTGRQTRQGNAQKIKNKLKINKQ